MKGTAAIVGVLSLVLVVTWASYSHDRTTGADATHTPAKPRATQAVAAPTAATPTPGAARAAAQAAAPLTATARTWWHPKNTGPNDGPEFQWELDHALNVHSVNDMGDGAVNAAGRKAPNPTVYDIDGIDNSASTVSALHRRGDKVICYIEIGAAGNYYSGPRSASGSATIHS